jgi:hypothetical protein
MVQVPGTITNQVELCGIACQAVILNQYAAMEVLP